jgi:HD-like signal output (HDOD) protein
MPITLETICDCGSRLPPSLGIFSRLQQILHEPTTDLDDLVALLRIDPSLTLHVIKLSNCVLYQSSSPCTSLEQAVARVGFGEVQQLVGLAVARQAFQVEVAHYDLPAGRLWENAVAAANLMSAFAKRAGADAPAAYSTGLLRGLGTVILNNYPGAVCFPGETQYPDVHAWEKKTHGLTAVEVSALLLEHWNFSPEMVSTVREHLAPESAAANRASAARLHLSCKIATEWGCGLPGETGRWRSDPSVCAQAGLREDDLAGAAAEARTLFSRCALIQWSNAA